MGTAYSRTYACVRMYVGVASIGHVYACMEREGSWRKGGRGREGGETHRLRCESHWQLGLQSAGVSPRHNANLLEVVHHQPGVVRRAAGDLPALQQQPAAPRVALDLDTPAQLQGQPARRRGAAVCGTRGGLGAECARGQAREAAKASTSKEVGACTHA